MTRNLIQKLTGAMIACLMVLAMTVTAYAHKVPAGGDLAMRNFIMAGGNLNELCGDGIFAPGDCPLCRLSDTATVPEPPAGLSEITYRFVLALEPVPPAPIRAAFAWSIPEARGPPSI
ncbi:hypothetical protein [Paracoccus sp. IB05]|uniref:hypothetical protein n=1 Tax=Paracoccus sp. IB05 TaxID=2779367 RepID=UPI0018E75E26|nr:hypothetical protein [Paracoccus sp. IB05]MBJ2150470.1 hypothetical protein [Paracoccus sp. IB05]